MVGDSLVGIIHKKPKEGGISAVGGTGSIYTYYGPKEKRFANLTKNFTSTDLPKIMPALGLESEPIPLWWTSDFINSSPEGTAAKDDTPNACYTDISKKDLVEVKKIGALVGKKALGILGKASSAAKASATEDALKAILKSVDSKLADNTVLID